MESTRARLLAARRIHARGHTVSRVYDALKKLEGQSRELAGEPVGAAPKTAVVTPRPAGEISSAPALQARVAPEDRIVVFSDPRSPGAERFRLIRMALRNFFSGKPQRTMLITSPLPRDGKSTVALNLATSLAEEGKVRVLLLEGDLHRPSLVPHLGVDRLPGVTEAVEDQVELASVIRRVEPLGFYLLPAGRASSRPVELLQSERFHSLLRDLKAEFDWVLIDCPPAFPLSDVVALRSYADAVLLVARAGTTPRELILETAQLFKPSQIAGLILNASEKVNNLYENYYGRRADGDISSASHFKGESLRPLGKSVPND